VRFFYVCVYSATGFVRGYIWWWGLAIFRSCPLPHCVLLCAYVCVHVLTFLSKSFAFLHILGRVNFIFCTTAFKVLVPP